MNTLKGGKYINKNPETIYRQQTYASAGFWKEAGKVIPGGVTANVKYFSPYPLFMRKATGSKLYDVDGNEYIDYCLCYGPLILGHGHLTVVEAIKRQLYEGGTTMYGTPHELEVKMAKRIKSLVPCAEMVRFSNSGLEATLHAIRVVRESASSTTLMISVIVKPTSSTSFLERYRASKIMM